MKCRAHNLTAMAVDNEIIRVRQLISIQSLYLYSVLQYYLKSEFANLRHTNNSTCYTNRYFISYIRSR